MNIREPLLSVQRALLGKVTLNLRSVYLNINKHYTELIFCYNTEPSEEEKELADMADTEFIADFPSPEYKTRFRTIIVPYPKKISKNFFSVGAI